MVMSEHHEHTFKGLELRPIKRIDNPHYQGNAGDKAFLVSTCTSCPKVKPMDYGPTDAMVTKLEALA